MKILDIGGTPVGDGLPCFVIAEAGVNHNGDPATALELIDAASAGGADAVKFQTFIAEHLAAPSAAKAGYQRRSGPPDESQLDMLRALELPHSAYGPLVKRCAERGITFLSTPFGEPESDFLDSLGVPAFKVGSGDRASPRSSREW